MAHWLVDPLGPRAVRILRDYADGDKHHPPREDFDVAYLIARECVDWNGSTVQINDKGRDALEFYS